MSDQGEASVPGKIPSGFEGFDDITFGGASERTHDVAHGRARQRQDGARAPGVGQRG